MQKKLLYLKTISLIGYIAFISLIVYFTNDLFMCLLARLFYQMMNFLFLYIIMWDKIINLMKYYLNYFFIPLITFIPFYYISNTYCFNDILFILFILIILYSIIIYLYCFNIRKKIYAYQ